jgi:GTP-binding protein Era
MDTRTTYCGYVVLLGAPNVGKSTLLNALVGERLSIVTPKAQTTWNRVTGLRTSETHQLILLDTPGVLAPRDLVQRSLLLAAGEAAEEADVLVLVADPVEPPAATVRELIAEVAARSRAPRIGVVNKVDAAAPESASAESAWLRTLNTEEVQPVSAERGDGIDALVAAIEARLPEGPFLYPDDEIASDPTRFFVSEMVREAVFLQFHEEIPYSAFCEVDEFRDGGAGSGPGPDSEAPCTYIQVTIYVERASQKAIIVGNRGSAIRALGTQARSRIEHFLGTPVYLDLWVKVLPDWRRRRDQLGRLGLPIPDETRAR